MEALSAGGKPWAASPKGKSFFFEKRTKKLSPLRAASPSCPALPKKNFKIPLDEQNKNS
jgi:hypothetical protein